MHSQWVYSCSRSDIDPSIDLPEIAKSILSLERELSALWQEYADIAMLSGLADPSNDDGKIRELLENSLDVISKGGSHSMLKSHPSGVDWIEEYGTPKSIHYGRDGRIHYTMDSGETFEQKE